MSAHNLLAELQVVDIGDGTTEKYIGDPDTYGKLIAFGDTVPTDATAGYAIGCTFHHLDGSDGTALYVNEGTLTSCDFNAITVA